MLMMFVIPALVLATVFAVGLSLYSRTRHGQDVYDLAEARERKYFTEHDRRALRRDCE